MKRKLIALSAMIFGFFFLTGIAIGQAQDSTKGFSLKITGGYGTMAVGDFNTVVEDMNSLYTYFMGDTKDGELKKLNYGIELEGEIIMKLPGNFGLGIGTGYYLRSKDSEFSVEDVAFGEANVSLKPEFTAIPITLTFYYFLPSKSLVNLYLNGGVGYYFGKATFTLRQDVEPVGFPPEWVEMRWEVKDQGFGFHGGVGLEFNVISKVAFFIEGNGIYCKLKNWEGDSITEDSFGLSDENSGIAWYYEEDLGLDRLSAQFIISEDKPDWGGISNVRKVEWNLSGVSLRVGIRIKF